MGTQEGGKPVLSHWKCGRSRDVGDGRPTMALPGHAAVAVLLGRDHNFPAPT